MTQQEAMQEARRRWGSFVQASRHWNRFIVGTLPDCEPVSAGIGNSWEEAFADADRREASK